MYTVAKHYPINLAVAVCIDNHGVDIPTVPNHINLPLQLQYSVTG